MFVIRVIPYALRARDQIPALMISEHGESRGTIYPSVISAAAILISKWGTSLLSQPVIRESVTNRSIPGNNLLHVRSNVNWRVYHDSIQIGGRLYRSYQDWGMCFDDVVDFYCYSRCYSELACCDPYEQIKLISRRKPNPHKFIQRMNAVLSKCNLTEIDSW